MRKDDPTYVYRLADELGLLLYVGVAVDVGRRFMQHARHKRWWPQVAHVDLELFATRFEALDAERLAIINERPIYNQVHNADNAGRVDEVRWFCASCNQQTYDGILVLEVGAARDSLRGYLAGEPFHARREPGLVRPFHAACCPYDLNEMWHDGRKAYRSVDLDDVRTTRDAYRLVVELANYEELGGTYAWAMFDRMLGVYEEAED